MSKKSSYLKFLRNSSKETVNGYNQSIAKYEELNQMSIDELVSEALDEQARLVPPHLLKIIERLENFQLFLIGEGYVARTITIHMSRIKAIYHKNRVVLPYIEQLNSKKIIKKEYVEFKDILTKDELRLAIPYMRLPAQARAMVMIQSGLSNEECEHLTTRKFIDELRAYHQKDDDVDALMWLADESHPVIWVTKLIRIKTGKPFYAIVGSEAINKIAEAKIYELHLPKNNGQIPPKLLSQHKINFNHSCMGANDKANLGYVAQVTYSNITDEDGNIYIKKSLFKHFVMLSDMEYKLIKENERVCISTDFPFTEIQYKLNGECKFSPHKLRKFHATYIRDLKKISNSDIDELQGRGKTNVQDTYIKSNPFDLKVIYAQVMNNVSLYHQYEYEIIDGDVRVFLKNAESMQKKIDELNTQLQKRKRASKEVQKLREMYGDDVLEQLIGEILSTS